MALLVVAVRVPAAPVLRSSPACGPGEKIRRKTERTFRKKLRIDNVNGLLLQLLLVLFMRSAGK